MTEDDYGDADLDDDDPGTAPQKSGASAVDASHSSEANADRGEANEESRVEDDGDVEGGDEAVAPKRSRALPVFFVVAAVATILLCLGTFASIAYRLGGVFQGEVYHVYVNGFGAVSTDLPGAKPAPVSGPSLGAWVMCAFAAVLIVVAVLRWKRPASQWVLAVAIAAALGQVVTAIYGAVVVFSQVGDFYSKLALNALALGSPATFSVGWATWVQLLLSFVILALAVGALVQDRNEGVRLIRL